MAGLKGDFTGFTFKGVHSSSLGITRVSGGDRYSLSLLPSSKDQTGEVLGANRMYYFNTSEGQREIELNIAFDNITEGNLRSLTRLLGDYTPGVFIFDEMPYKYYNAKIENNVKLDYICFNTSTGARVYKGEGSISLVCYDPMGYSTFKFLDQYTKANIPHWDNDDGNTSEWSDYINLLETQGDVDKIYYSTPSVNVYNPGDKVTPMKIYILGEYDESSQAYLFNCKVNIVEDSTKQLVIYGSSPYSLLCVDMASHLILTCDNTFTYSIDTNGIFYKDGSVYKLRVTGSETGPFYNINLASVASFITEDMFYAGNYFDLNLSPDSNDIYTLTLSNGVSNTKKGKIVGIEYSYLFY